MKQHGAGQGIDGEDRHVKSGILGPIIVGIVVALVAGGSAPWWWTKVFPPRAPAPIETSPSPVPTLPPLVDGKQIVRASRLRDLFPFGYYVFSKKEGRWTYEATPEANKLQYHIDPKRVQIEPDFAKKTVHWTIPFSAERPDGQGGTYRDNIVGVTVPMVTLRGQSGEILHGVFSVPLTLAHEENQPSAFVVTLDDDQRFPVFALGFRIVEEPTQPSLTPAPR